MKKTQSRNQNLTGKRVAILLTDGFEESEMVKPRQALIDAGAKTDLIAPKAGQVKSWSKDNFGADYDVDLALDDALSSDYDALLLPGGVMNPDKLRTIPAAVDFVRSFFDDSRPVAAICHGPQLLIEADVVKGRRLTSFPSLKTDLANAGATWVDEAVVVDEGLVTSRRPDDIPQFNSKMIEEFAEGVHLAK